MYNPLWINVTWLVILCHPTHDDVEMWHRTNMSNLFCTNDERGITHISTILKWISPTIFAWYFRTIWCHVMAYGFQCSFYLLTKNHGTGSIGWVLWWSRQWIKRLRRKLFISCFMKISAFIQTSVSLGAYQNDGSKPSYIFFIHETSFAMKWCTHTRLTCSKLNNYHWNVYYCLQAHQRFMQMYTFTWNAKQIFFFFK